jgi:hypothetical protein
MSKNAESTTLNQLTLFAEDSLASLTVLPGSKEARKMTETSGRNIAALLPNSDPVGLLVRMFLTSGTPCSMMCFLTWTVSTTQQSRLIYQLSPSVPNIDDTESSLWPTPTSRDYRSDRASEEWTKRREMDTRGKTLPFAVGGTLNPPWVEWLQGFPMDWTEV